MVYVLNAGVKAEAAQKSEDEDALKAVGQLIDRCEFALIRIVDMTTLSHDHRVYTVLNQLATNMSIFARQYSRYLESESLDDVNEAEIAIADAQISNIEDLGDHVGLLRERIAKIRDGVRDVNDPRLLDARRKF